MNVCPSPMLSQTTSTLYRHRHHMLMGGGLNNKTSIRIGRHSLYFIEPQPNKNAKLFANELIGIEGVEEVHITSGDVGYVVTARKEASEALEKYIKKNALKCRHIESHYIVSRR